MKMSSASQSLTLLIAVYTVDVARSDALPPEFLPLRGAHFPRALAFNAAGVCIVALDCTAAFTARSPNPKGFS